MIRRDDETLASVTEELRAAGCVFAEEEAELLLDAAEGPAQLRELVGRRASGQPLEYVLGWAEFCGLRIAVGPNLFVPRRRTEFLVHVAAAQLRVGHVVVDLCCGSGAVGAALLKRLPGIELHAADVDRTAVRYARRNLGPMGPVHEGDLFDALPASLRGRVDAIVCNAPYVPTQAMERMPREARLYEPPAALDGGEDGLDLQRRVVSEAGAWLALGGHLFLETSARQSRDTAELFRRAGLGPQVLRSEELDASVVAGRRERA